MKIFIDFDDTIFNTKKFKSDLMDIFLKNGISEKQFSKTYYDYPKKTVRGFKKYEPRKQIDILAERTETNGKKIKQDLGKLVRSSSKYVFPDVRSFLAAFEKKDLCLMSFGKTRFQGEKIMWSGLADSFSRIVVSDRPKAEEIASVLRGKNIKIVFIDDRLDQIGPVKKNFPNSFTFLISRSEGRYQYEKTKAVDFKIGNLNEAKRLIGEIGA